MRRLASVALVATLVAIGLVVAAPAVGAADAEFVVPGTAGGPTNGGTAAVSTGIVLTEEKWVLVTATGTVNLCAPGNCNNAPNGGVPGNSTPNSLVPSSPYGCLAARIGAGTWGCIGAGPAILWGEGELQLAVNDDFVGGVGSGVGYQDNTGQFDVEVEFPMATITIEKDVVGTDPGVEFPVTVTCEASGTPVTPDAVGAAATRDAEIFISEEGDEDSATVEVPDGGTRTVDVWWTLSPGAIPDFENLTCTITEDLSVVPEGISCTAEITPDEVVLYDQSREIEREEVSVEVTNTCSETATTTTTTTTAPTPAPATAPVKVQPTFTG